jgi:hypothetical protein
MDTVYLLIYLYDDVADIGTHIVGVFADKYDAIAAGHMALTKRKTEYAMCRAAGESAHYCGWEPRGVVKVVEAGQESRDAMEGDYVVISYAMQ